jgi:hypothetical protein
MCCTVMSNGVSIPLLTQSAITPSRQLCQQCWLTIEWYLTLTQCTQSIGPSHCHNVQLAAATMQPPKAHTTCTPHHPREEGGTTHH